MLINRNNTLSNKLLQLVQQEYDRATSKFTEFNTPHEGYAVILEELDELWELIKTNRGGSDAAMDEALQIVIMALRYIVDLDPQICN